MSPSFEPTLPITAGATTIPSSSSFTALRLPFGSVTSAGPRTRESFVAVTVLPSGSSTSGHSTAFSHG
ncbi:hypothetical protein [Polyangium sorediatum]|uniref:Uncharacterized protein n=1 Tax=Polyangium sorediatum TaxID=889274 RepID=A0ABT6NSS4_9BACT|nr:hypothetical protein [Polyangium sorediatum]MDI1431381.1 hypothetical protein [Polyangium sorediatum]